MWFRNDLRLHDNEALLDSLTHNEEVIPLYVVDPRLFKGKTSFGFPKLGPYRRKFLEECLTDLRQGLRSLGSELYVRYGYPEVVIPELARNTKVHYVYCNRERTRDEVTVQDSLEKNLWASGQEMRYYRGKMLYYTADLPFPVTHCPDTFTSFRKEVEKFVPIRSPLNKPEYIPTLTQTLESGDIPTYCESEGQKQGVGEKIKGGETEALKELRYYIWESDNIASYKETRNGLLGRDYSSKLSAHLSKGTLSPKLVYQEVKRYEAQVVKNKSTYSLIFELLWRDFFRFMAKKHGDKIFLQGGTQSRSDLSLKDDRDLLEKWTSGKTGVPFIDANMRELNATGFMSNRGRQNVASFLVKDLKVNWIWGAEYFESMLIDYDPCSNYGNWNYVSGVGSDPRQDRYFNVPLQAKKYDPKGEYIRTWLPELKSAPDKFLFNPFTKDLDYVLSPVYPAPCMEIANWCKASTK